MDEQDVRMLVGPGYAPDLGSYAFDLFRRTPALAWALDSEPIEEPA